jgi:HD-GYP domain-containing protein (c-di-GMP phosphodiesterase class II)
VRILAAIVDPHHLPQVDASGNADRYHVVHPVNTALLAMTASAAVGLDGTGRHRIGVVALLHDIGMALLPADVVDNERISDAKRAQVESHTTLGATLLLEKGGTGFDLAAVVAFEHHLRPDGGGYPVRRFGPAPHWASGMVGCCATFAALRAPRPFRAGWATERVVRYIDDGAGTEFDPDIARLVAGLVRPA